MLVIPIFIPHAGCPNDCVFCNQKVISGQTKQPSVQSISEIVERYRTCSVRYSDVEIAFFGGSFTAISDDLQEIYLNAVQKYLKKNGGFVDRIRLSTRPDAISEKVLERLLHYNATVVELGAQSMDDHVLKLSNRGHNSNATVTASKLIKAYGLTLGLQTMPGLPGSSFESDVETAKKIADLRPSFVRIYPTIVVKHTKLETDFLSGDFAPLTLDNAVALTYELSKIYISQGIKIIRMGLQSTDTISRNGKESEVVGGPFHESFGELVESFACFKEIEDKLSQYMEAMEIKDINFINIYIPKSKIPCVIGYKQENALKIKNKFNAKHIKALGFDSENLSKFEMRENPICSVFSIDSEITFIERNELNKVGKPALNISLKMNFNQL